MLLVDLQNPKNKKHLCTTKFCISGGLRRLGWSGSATLGQNLQRLGFCSHKLTIVAAIKKRFYSRIWRRASIFKGKEPESVLSFLLIPQTQSVHFIFYTAVLRSVESPTRIPASDGTRCKIHLCCSFYYQVLRGDKMRPCLAAWIRMKRWTLNRFNKELLSSNESGRFSTLIAIEPLDSRGLWKRTQKCVFIYSCERPWAWPV